MGQTVSRLSMAALGVVITVALLAGVLTTAALAEGDIDIVVSPNMLSLKSTGDVISIHADITFASVTGVEVSVNGDSIDVLSTFADDRGDLVIKCDRQEVIGLVSVGTAIFVASITIEDEVLYSGVDTITVISGRK